jgi:hypothetical protein
MLYSFEPFYILYKSGSKQELYLTQRFTEETLIATYRGMDQVKKETKEPGTGGSLL